MAERYWGKVVRCGVVSQAGNAVDDQPQHALKGQKLLAQGNRPGLLRTQP